MFSMKMKTTRTRKRICHPPLRWKPTHSITPSRSPCRCSAAARRPYLPPKVGNTRSCRDPTRPCVWAVRQSTRLTRPLVRLCHWPISLTFCSRIRDERTFSACPGYPETPIPVLVTLLKDYQPDSVCQPEIKITRTTQPCHPLVK